MSGCSSGKRQRWAAVSSEAVHASRSIRETVRVTFDDVAGIDEVEAEINEVVDFLRDPEKYRRLGARAPKGVLLAGAPGTGKTCWPAPPRERRTFLSSAPAPRSSSR